MNDNDFIRKDKVPMTKEEIRAISILKLELNNAKTLLDIGGGSGSLSIEACMNYKELQTTIIEKKENALELINLNKDKFNVKNLKIIKGNAPVDELVQKFDRIFIGGGGMDLDIIIDWASKLLNPNGVMVINVITLQSFNLALESIKQLEKNYDILVDTSMVQVNKLNKLAKYDYFKPLNPVYIMQIKFN